jgi:hypothetical protein
LSNGWHTLSDPEIRDFILAHEEFDVAALGLKKPPHADWLYPLVLDQIKARRKAKTKLPSWYANTGIIFPAPELIEQASSEATARYKASLVKGNLVIDLTAGTGADFLALLENFESGIAIEQDKTAAEILTHNLKILTRKNFEVRNADAENIAKTLPDCDVIYLDPQRRNNRGKGLFRLEDCSPDITALLPCLQRKAKTIMLKAAPVLDINRAVRDLETVSEVHVIEWRGECREVVYLLSGEAREQDISITAVTIDDHGTPQRKLSFTRAEETNAPMLLSQPLRYLFEPSPAFQKAGCHKYLAHYYGVHKLHPHTHLYTSDTLPPDFPGRLFEIRRVYGAGDASFPLTQANLTIRNFPAQTEALRKKLQLKDGGMDYVFACTLENERKVLIHTVKTDPGKI